MYELPFFQYTTRKLLVFFHQFSTKCKFHANILKCFSNLLFVSKRTSTQIKDEMSFDIYTIQFYVQQPRISGEIFYTKIRRASHSSGSPYIHPSLTAPSVFPGILPLTGSASVPPLPSWIYDPSPRGSPNRSHHLHR